MQNIILQRKKHVFVLAIVILGAAGIAWIASGGVDKGLVRTVDANTEPTPNFIQQGDQLVIPSGSPLRQRIAVQAVTTLDAAHVLELPAQVEADPARTINILPPVAGKVLELKAGLGDHVRKGQLLLVMASGDFAQAVSDRQKARDALQLANKVLERQRGAQAAGAGAANPSEGGGHTHPGGVYAV